MLNEEIQNSETESLEEISEEIHLGLLRTLSQISIATDKIVKSIEQEKYRRLSHT